MKGEFARRKRARRDLLLPMRAPGVYNPPIDGLFRLAECRPHAAGGFETRRTRAMQPAA